MLKNGEIKEFLINSSEEMQSFAEKFAATLQGGAIITLQGDLGYGKTTFVQGLARGLGITRRIISPTFMLIRSYRTPNERELYHVDLYRLHEEKESETLGLQDIFHKSDAIVVIEWPERIATIPEKHIVITFTYLNDTNRKITIQRRD